MKASSAAEAASLCCVGSISAFLVIMMVSLGGEARAQLLDRYAPANVPAYQDWTAAALPQQGDSIYGPLGVRIGSFVIDPGLTETVGYDSNPLGLPNGNGGAIIYDKGAFAVNSDWSRNAVNATITVDRTDVLAYPNQSYTTWTATAGGLLIYGDSKIEAGYSHVYGVTLPTDVGTFGVAQPIIDQVDDIRVDDTLGAGRITLVPALIGDVYRFSGMGGTNLTNVGGLFNRNALTASLTSGYEFGGGHNAIVAVSNTVTDYSGGLANVRPANNDDVSIMTGLEYKQSAILIYRALVGYEVRSAISIGTNRATISAPAAEFDMIWTPDSLTTVTGKVGQSLADAPTDVAQGLRETDVKLLFNRSVQQDITVDGSLQYVFASFNSSSQSQSAFSVSAGATWSLTRRIALSIRYEFTNAIANAAEGNVNTPGNSFNREQLLLAARFQL